MTRALYTPEECRERKREGGRISPANFANDRAKAVDAGRAGGFAMAGKLKKLGPEGEARLYEWAANRKPLKCVCAELGIAPSTARRYLNNMRKVA
jgi:general stress protein YciG